MKEYLEKQADGSYKLVMRGIVGKDGDIEVPEGATHYATDSNLGIKKNYFFRCPDDAIWIDSQWMRASFSVSGQTVLWKRHTQPEELPFIDNEPKEYLREDGNGSYILELTCKQEATEPHAKHWIEVPVGVNFYYSFASGDKVFTKEHLSLGRLLWQRKTYFSLNDQYAEIEQVRKHRHYFKDVSNIDEIDVYAVLKLFEVTDPCLQHIVKKALCAGKRGHKDMMEDLQNIVDTAIRAVELNS